MNEFSCINCQKCIWIFDEDECHFYCFEKSDIITDEFAEANHICHKAKNEPTYP